MVNERDDGRCKNTTGVEPDSEDKGYSKIESNVTKEGKRKQGREGLKLHSKGG